MQPLTDHPWHNLSAGQSAELLQSDPATGLDGQEAGQRLERFGANRITTQRVESPVVRFLRQFHQPLIYILIGSAIITALLHEWIDSAVISGVVIANALIGYIQESKAVHALAALARTMTSEATVLRRGIKIRIDAVSVVPGDIIFLASGDKVPADMRLMQEQGLQIDESALTGESVPAEKSIEPVELDTEPANRSNMAYATTLVTHGQGMGIAVATGDRSEVGRISQLIASARALETPLTRKITSFSRILLYLILALAGVTVIIGLIRGQNLFDMFMAAVALAVGAIPEGLPAAVTITLAIGVARMARRKAIIRKLPAVETLGSTTIICSDKTGTLTENKMSVRAVLAGARLYAVTGTGYDPQHGHITVDNSPIEPEDHPALLACLRAGVLCNDSILRHQDGQWLVQGDPTEGALLTAAGKAGLPVTDAPRQENRLDSIPFESQQQYMATLIREDATQAAQLIVKGSLEVVLHACQRELDQQGRPVPLDTEKIHRVAEQMASEGLRILAFAGTATDAAMTRIPPGENLAGLTFFGLQGMMDPPRQEAIQAVRTCQQAGILVKMITGDHALTARAIAATIGLRHSLANGDGPVSVISGRELNALTDEELVEVVRSTAVFARTTPEQKLRLVRALQAQNHIVAMTGDGVNDAPALKQADIGVAMGVNGTEVAREAADMVLTDDNFTSIEAAVEEGRGVLDNLTKFIAWTLPTNLGEGLVIVAAIFLGITLPILPLQILWINMTTAGFLGLMLAFEPKEDGIMLRPPRDPELPILTRPLIIRITLVGILLLISTFVLFHLELRQGATLEQARTVAVNTFVIIELFYLFNCRSLDKSFFAQAWDSNLWVIGGAGIMMLVQILYTYVPIMNHLFQSSPISGRAWLHIGTAGLIAFFIVEAEKWLQQKKFH